MLLSPLDYVPVEVAMRTTQNRQAFRAQPRRTIRNRVLAARRRKHTLAA